MHNYSEIRRGMWQQYNSQNNNNQGNFNNNNFENNSFHNNNNNNSNVAGAAANQCNNNHHSTVQTHTHEFLGSTKLAEENDERHNHRFAGVTSEVIPLKGGNHKHAILTNTDFFDHLHEIGVETGPAVDVGDGKHVHFVEGRTTINDDHFHNFQFATLIEAPLLPLCD